MIVRRVVVAAVLLLLAGCGGVAPAAEVPPVAAPVTAPVVAAPEPGVPVLVELPTLGVSDDVVQVGLEPNGEMEVPPVQQSGWYDLGPRPGQVGPATIIGHINYGGVRGVLGRIGELKVGAQVVVGDDAGVSWVFSVYDIRTIKKASFEAVAVPLIFSSTPGPELRLVTCGGALVGSSYDSNVVVRARLVQP